MSLPSRGAWIEICPSCFADMMACVAPLTGSVDRNFALAIAARNSTGRSPHGERG